MREFKIEYQLNQLASMSSEDGDIITAIANSDEIKLFTTDAVIDLIDFRWKQFAFKFHSFNVSVHFAYVIYLFFYVKWIFIDVTAIEPKEIMKIDNVKDSDEEIHDIINPEVDKRIYPTTNMNMQLV